MQENMNKMFDIDPYRLSKEEKRTMFQEDLKELNQYHYNSCMEYHKVLEFIGNKGESLEEMPMIPVRLFKEFELCSVDKNKIVKTMTSSGTSGQQVSKVFLNADNVKMQTKVLSHIMESYIGNRRLPMLILDTPIVKKDRAMFSARGAGIVGFSMFGRKIHYALDENMELDVEGVKRFFETYRDQKVLLFGYTYMIWQFIVEKLQEKGIQFHLENGILFHVGGWKKLKDKQVDTNTYNSTIRELLGNIQIYNYYGMAEQLGSIFVECENGHLHCSNFSDILIRRSKDFSVADFHEKGIIELLSLLPISYPGHILLTEDEGEILGEDDCPCGRKGKYFKIHGRIQNAEVRGCSDTYENKQGG